MTLFRDTAIKTTVFVLAISTVAGLAVQIGQRQLQPANKILSTSPTVKLTFTESHRIIESNGIPNHAVGEFPSPGNPNAISTQRHRFLVPLKRTAKSEEGGRKMGPPSLFGVAINGIPFDPGTAKLWNNNFRFHYEALSGQLANGLGLDSNHAHVQPSGTYHYHGFPTALLEKLNYRSEMALVGWAADGYPIYGNYAYARAMDPISGLKKIKSSYVLKQGRRAEGPEGLHDGSFASDYAFDASTGDLGELNGRYGVTHESPKGTYYYVLTESFPFIPREHKGVADSSFKKAQPPGREANSNLPHWATTTHRH